MAAESTTTSDTDWAVTAPSRRKLLGGSILAALSGAAFGSAVMLPDPGEAAPTLVNPDARLIALCAEFLHFDVSAEAVSDDDDLASLIDARDALAQRISATPAASAAGLQAKARVGHFLVNERHCPGEPFDDVDTYALALLRELMAGVVNPPARPVSPDARLIALCAEAMRLDHAAGATEVGLDECDELLTQWFVVAEQASATPALTLAGMQAKARIVLHLMTPASRRPDTDKTKWEEGSVYGPLAWSLVNDLAAVA